MKDWPFFVGFAVGSLSIGYLGLCVGFVAGAWHAKLLRKFEIPPDTTRTS